MDNAKWNANLPYLYFGCYGNRTILMKGSNNSLGCFHGALGMEQLDVCALCPENHAHPDCNSNKCPRRPNSADPNMASRTDEAGALSDSQMMSSFHNTNTAGSSQPSSCSGSLMHESNDYQWCLDYGYNREFHNLKKFPQGVLSSTFESTLISSYDDVSKNIDANLAEIDMETFRSEDIHSILALPAIYGGGELQSSRREKSASVSESLLGAFELDSSTVSPRSTSEDGSTSMSVCKDELLFSPVREQQMGHALGTFSTDSLDCGSSFAEPPDLVLTCRANKNNYTIAFEGSGNQFSDDSDYLEVEGSSDGDSGLWQDQGVNNGNLREGGKGRGDMIQSDCVFTTWSKLRRLKETSRSYGRKNKTPTSGAAKSQSLPNLLRQSVLIIEKPSANIESSWDSGKFGGSKDSSDVCLPLFDIQNSQLIRSKDSEGSSSGPVSLLKLFIQQRTASVSSLDGGSVCSSQSEGSPPQQNSECLLTVIGRNQNENLMRLTTEEEETNNNNLPAVLNNLNLNNKTELIQENEEETSQCFEDSLMEAQAPRNVPLQASVIREEDEPTENSSSDETMQDMKDPFLTDSGTSEEHSSKEAKNNSKCLLKKNNNTMERITNVFPTGKSNQLLKIACCATLDDKFLTEKRIDLVPSIQNQGTQTKRVNRGASASSNGTTDSAESLPLSEASSCSSRASPTLGTSSRKLNVSIATTRTCGTQIPVHIKDQEVQTSTYNRETVSGEWSFTLKESLEGMEERSESGRVCLSPMERPSSPTPPPGESKDKNQVEKAELEEPESQNKSKEFREIKLSPSDKSIYVCYPNYSLPDLSFLRAMNASPEHSNKDGNIILNPTGRRQNLRQPAQRRSYSSEGRTPTEAVGGQKRRPQSCNDFERLSRQGFKHIRDWDSLKVLLPVEIRNIISSIRTSEPLDRKPPIRKSSSCSKNSPCHLAADKNDLNVSMSSSSGSSSSGSSLGGAKAVGPHFGVLKEVPPPIPKRSLSLPTTENGGNNSQYPRSILRKSSSSGHCNNATGGISLPPKCRSASMMPWVEDAKSKRRSLQEPFHCLLENIPEALKTSEQHQQLLYNMEHSRIQEGGEEQPALEPFCSDPNPVLKGPSLPEGYGKGCKALYRTGSKTSHPSAECSDSSSDDSSSSDLQKLLVSSAALNYADALLAGHLNSPLSPVDTENNDWTCGCLKGKKSVSFSEDVELPGAYYDPHREHLTEDYCPAHTKNLHSPFKNSKIVLLKSVDSAIKIVLDCFDEALNLNSRSKLYMEGILLDNLCTSLHNLLSDGLLPTVTGIFGIIQNSPWRLAENSSQQEPKVSEFHELVSFINGEPSFCNNNTKFCSFLFGLLNLRMLDQWMAKLLRSPELISMNYRTDSLMYMASCSSSATYSGLLHQITAILEPLSDIPFQLDLLVPAAALASPQRIKGSHRRPLSCPDSAFSDPLYPAGGLPSFQSYQGLDRVSRMGTNINQELKGKDGVYHNEDYEDNPGFQELRQKWENISGKPPHSPAFGETTQASTGTSEAKPPHSGTHRTREGIKKPFPSSNKGSSPLHLRSKLPSPVRALTSPNRSLPQTPETSPKHVAEKPSPLGAAATRKGPPSSPLNGRLASPAHQASVRTAPSALPRKSMIPVHRHANVRPVSNLGPATKRQPVLARHPNGNRNN